MLWSVGGPKVTAYLLNLNHKRGASKARYLLGFGFSPDDPKALADALVEHAMGNLPGVVKQELAGPNRVVFEGYVAAPDGRQMPLRTVWEAVGTDEEHVMRFITAVPLTK